MRDTNVAGILRRQGRERAAETAFVAPTRTWTFGEVDTESNRVAQGLAALGVGPGDRVACLTRHMADCALLMFAACKLGAVCMPVNWRLAAPEIEYIVDHGQAKFMMVDEEFAPTLAKAKIPGLLKTVSTDAPAGQVLASGHQAFADWRAPFEARDPGYEASPEETTLQLYSSGTTGLPKGVELSNRGFMEVCEMGPPVTGFTTGKVMLNALPTFHIAGMGNLVMPVWAGAKVVFMPDFVPSLAIRAIEEHRVTHSFMVPAMILFMLQAPEAKTADFSSLEVISYGGSPISDTVLLEALRVLRCGLFQVYGMTEAPLLTQLPPEDHVTEGERAFLLRSAGKPSPGVQIRIVRSADGQDAAEGEVGEIWVRTYQNMKGYWRNPKATDETFPEGRADGIGWMRTGDAGYLKGGYLFIHDRIKDMVISGGENIYPAEVENALAKHPAVLECAIIGVPDEKWGEAVKACVVLKPGAQATEREVIDFMRENLAHYKCPKSVDFLQQLPRNPTGKLLKRVLREPYWAGRDRAVS
jgi:acyl-CoA synthetase (AMP-forming)/AMP-acid ligase II